MICPECQADALRVERAIELPSDAANDEITLQTVVCRQCGLQALAVYRESRRGALDSESWQHEGYRVRAADFKRVRQLIRRCPSPSNPRCGCAVHQQFGHQRDYRWDGLEHSGVEIQGVFDIQSGKL